MTPKGKDTLLLLFAKKRYTEETIYLIDSGSKIFDVDYEGNTVLHYATLNKEYVTCIRILDDRTSSPFRMYRWLNNGGYTVLHLSIINRSPFVELYMRDNNHEVSTRDGKTCLQIAEEYYPEVRELFVVQAF